MYRFGHDHGQEQWATTYRRKIQGQIPPRKQGRLGLWPEGKENCDEMVRMTFELHNTVQRLAARSQTMTLEGVAACPLGQRENLLDSLMMKGLKRMDVSLCNSLVLMIVLVELCWLFAAALLECCCSQTSECECLSSASFCAHSTRLNSQNSCPNYGQQLLSELWKTGFYILLINSDLL